eukprot:10691620-Alexandrium_andersonii.AAC.1
MVEEQFLARNSGDEWKRAHGNDNPVRPAKELLPEILLPNGEPNRKSDYTEEDERYFYEKARQ